MNDEPKREGKSVRTVSAMMPKPEISVVMSVYNGADLLAESIESVLSQADVSFEFVIVNDGSTDATGSILSTFQKQDPRIRVMTQSNQGLTRALIAGCNQARGRYIARQDCGDVSLPGRLKAQRDILAEAQDCLMVSSGTQFVGPEGDHLYDVVQTTAELQEGLSRLTLDDVRGPSHHGTTMFRRNAFEEVGGYRPAFVVAQDLDLWLRLWELGSLRAIPQIHYQAKWLPKSISSKRRQTQIEATSTILSCAWARRSGQDEMQYLQDYKAKPLTAIQSSAAQRQEEAKFYTFIAGTLRQNQPLRARYYYSKAIRTSKLFIPAWVGMARTLIPR